MDRMLVVVFTTESQAYEGKKALHELENEGSVVIYANAVVGKNADGTSALKDEEDLGPLGTLLGTSFGALIGALGGPIGLAIGSSVGLAAGSAADIDAITLGEDFINDVIQELQPNRFALVAEIQEEWTTPVDTRMEAIGGTVFRRGLSDVSDTINAKTTAAIQADIAQMEAEHARSHADRKAKLQEKINQLNSRLQVRLAKAQERSQAAEQQRKAKVKLLETRAAALKDKTAAIHV